MPTVIVVIRYNCESQDSKVDIFIKKNYVFTVKHGFDINPFIINSLTLWKWLSTTQT